MSKRKWTQYSDEDKASALLMLEAAGYPKSPGALARTEKESGVPATTLRDWFTGAHGAPPANVRQHKKSELTVRIEELIDKSLEHAENVLSGAEFKDTVTSAAILIDKLLLLKGETTQNTSVNQRIIVEYADDTDIVTEAATVAERRYQDGEAF